MVRYFPQANPALDPYYPHLLNFTPANVPLAMFGHSGDVGISIGLARYGINWLSNRRSRGLCMRSAAVCAVILVPFTTLLSMNQPGSVASKKKPYFTNRGKIDVDDWFLGGALLGAALAAVPVRRPGVMGWKRYLGAACIGSLVGLYVYERTHHREYKRAVKLQREYKKQRAGDGGTTYPTQSPREPGK